MLYSLIKDCIDIIAIGETKLDETFSNNEFFIEGFKKPYRLDKSKNSGGLMVYIKSHIPSRILSDFLLPKDFQAIPFEISFKNRKWLVVSLYNPCKTLGSIFLKNLSNLIDFYLKKKYENLILIGDLNLQPSEAILSDFMENYELRNLINTKTCFKSIQGTCIDLILTNKSSFFQNTGTIETGLSDFMC